MSNTLRSLRQTINAPCCWCSPPGSGSENMDGNITCIWPPSIGEGSRKAMQTGPTCIGRRTSAKETMWMDVDGCGFCGWICVDHTMDLKWTGWLNLCEVRTSLKHLSEERNTWQYLHHGEYGRCRGRSGGCEAHVVDVTLKHPARALLELFSRHVSFLHAATRENIGNTQKLMLRHGKTGPAQSAQECCKGNANVVRVLLRCLAPHFG